MATTDFKIIWDAVHGQIKIPSSYCKNILDTLYFQRLKRLEQTNTRPLYPCAHHDRFIHSIGTFHLGTLAFKSIVENSKDYISSYAKNKNIEIPVNWEILEQEFSLACLLHDVGHAPFSHTFEKYFNVDIETGEKNLLDNLLLNLNANHKIPHIENHHTSFTEFVSDYKKAIKNESIAVEENGKSHNFGIGTNPKEHEKVSAFLVLKKFQTVISTNFSADPFNVARMILGIKFSKGYSSVDAINKQIINCFIELLNGEDIDVDKIDYLIRDQWATGNVFRHIDYNRLLNSIYIHEDSFTNRLSLCFHKKSINELIAIKDTKKSLVINTHSHPIVKYDDYILRKAINESIKAELKTFNQKNNTLSEENHINEYNENYVSKIVSINALLDHIKFADHTVFLPTDDDLIYLLKKNVNNSLYSKEWLSRDYRLKAVWKSPHDFMYHFNSLKQFEKAFLFNKIHHFTQEFVDGCDWGYTDLLSKKFFIEKEVKSWLIENTSNINILISNSNSKTVKLSKLIEPLESLRENLPSTNSYFLVYLPSPFILKKLDDNRNDYIKKFVPFLRDKVEKYKSELEKSIIVFLGKNPNSNAEKISTKLIKKKIFSNEDFDEFNQSLNMFLPHLVKKKLIQCNNKEQPPKKRTYSLL
jgi:HD superfamily phosphohydrolase